MADQQTESSSSDGNGGVQREGSDNGQQQYQSNGVAIEENAVTLKPKIGLISGTSIIVGCIIGSGIFVSPKGVIQEVGSVGVSLIIWLLCGLFSMVGAYCYTELGTSIVRSGADYAYMFEAFGPFIAFLRLWIECMIVRPCTTAVVALTFANYIIEPFFPTCDQPDTAVRLLAALCIIVLTLVNSFDVKLSMQVQNVFTYAKIFALILIIITGIVQLFRGEVEHFRNPFEGSTISAGSLAISFYQGLFAYSGWNYLNYVVEELKDPSKNLPKATWISCTLVTVIYAFVNIAYFTTVSPTEVIESAAVAGIFAQRLYGVMAWIMPVFVAMSTFGSVNGVLFTSSRLFYVGSREGHMPEVLCFIQIHRLTPAPAVIFMGICSLVYLCSSDIYKLINYVSFVNWLAIGLSVVALLYFRWTRPEMKRPIKVGLFWPILYILASIFLVAVPLYTAPVETGFGVLIICTGIPFYFVCVVWKSKPKSFIRLVGRLNVCIQKLLLVIPEDKKS